MWVIFLADLLCIARPHCPLQTAAARYTHSLFLRKLGLLLSVSRSFLPSSFLSSSQQHLILSITFYQSQSRRRVLRADEVWEKKQQDWGVGGGGGSRWEGGGSRPVSSEGTGEIWASVLDIRESTAGEIP